MSPTAGRIILRLPVCVLAVAHPTSSALAGPASLGQPVELERGLSAPSWIIRPVNRLPSRAIQS